MHRSVFTEIMLTVRSSGLIDCYMLHARCYSLSLGLQARLDTSSD